MDAGKGVTLIIGLLISAIVVGLVFIPIVDSIGDPTVTYSDASTTTAIGGSATTVTWVTGDNGGVFTGVADGAITIGAYTATYDFDTKDWIFERTSAPGTVLATSVGETVRLAATTGGIWFNYQFFADTTTITGVTLSVAGMVGTEYTSTDATVHTTDTTVVTLFGVMGLLVALLLIYTIAKYIQKG